MSQKRFVRGSATALDKQIVVTKTGVQAINLYIEYPGNLSSEVFVTLTHEQLRAIVDMASLETGFYPKSTAKPMIPWATGTVADAPIVNEPHGAPRIPTPPKGPQQYKGNGKHEWEAVVDTGMSRLRVPGGWLYSGDYGEVSTFVPMPDVVGYDI